MKRCSYCGNNNGLKEVGWIKISINGPTYILVKCPYCKLVFSDFIKKEEVPK